MKNIITIVRKELARFFLDKRLVLSVLIFPGLMIYILYSFMGTRMQDMINGDTSYTPIVYAVNMPQGEGSIGKVFETSIISGDLKIELRLDSDLTEEEKADNYQLIKNKIKNKKIDVLIVFDEDFKVEVPPIGEPSSIQIYYNSAKTESQTAYTSVVTTLGTYEKSITKLFDLVAGDLASAKEAGAKILADLLPLLILTFIFSGCMSVTPESIAGEKERGTIATLLVTPIKRSELAFGKIISLTILSLLSAISSFIGILFSLPKMMQGTVDNVQYGPTEFAAVFLVILSSVLLLVSIVAIISTYAKSIKEATTFAMPLMLLVMVIGILSMTGATSPKELYYYLIPLYSCVQVLNAIFSFNLDWTTLLVTVISSLVYFSIMVFLLVKMFNSERIMFNK